MKKGFIQSVITLLIFGGCVNGDQTKNKDIEFTNDGKIRLVRSWLSEPHVGNLVCSFDQGGNLKQVSRHDQNDSINGYNLKYYKNGLPDEIIEYSEGNLGGLYIKYFETGMISGIGFLDQDGLKEGRWITYHENGLLEGVRDYVSDRINGNLKGYHSNGELFVSGQCSNDIRVGKWEVYDKDRIHLETITFKEGIVQERVQHNQSKYGTELKL